MKIKLEFSNGNHENVVVFITEVILNYTAEALGNNNTFYCHPYYENQSVNELHTLIY